MIFPVQLTTSRIGNLTRLILTIALYNDRTYIRGSQVMVLIQVDKKQCFYNFPVKQFVARSAPRSTP